MKNEAERGIADRAGTIASEFSYIAGLIRFPSPIRGKRILDVGSGLSLAGYELKKMGASVVSLDYGYRNTRSLIRSFDKNLSERDYLKSLVPLEHPDLTEEKIEELTDDFIKSSRRTRDRFVSNYNRGDREMVGALAGALPFPDSSFDFYFSVSCVDEFLVEEQVFGDIISEALRVVKPGGEIQIFPWTPPLLQVNDNKKIISMKTLASLRSKGVRTATERVISAQRDLGEYRLSLFLPAA